MRRPGVRPVRICRPRLWRGDPAGSPRTLPRPRGGRAALARPAIRDVRLLATTRSPTGSSKSPATIRPRPRPGSGRSGSATARAPALAGRVHLRVAAAPATTAAQALKTMDREHTGGHLQRSTGTTGRLVECTRDKEADAWGSRFPGGRTARSAAPPRESPAPRLRDRPPRQSHRGGPRRRSGRGTSTL